MSLTRRGKGVIAAVTVVAVGVGALAYFALFPDKAPAFVRQTLSTVGLSEPAPPPPTCPLTGMPAPDGKVPERPALAVKIENAPEARPQSGLNDADIVYEEPVEGGYTRFIAIFQCGSSTLLGPVRSSRTTDPAVLRQFGRPVFGYAGGVAGIARQIERARLIDVNYVVAADAYWRDDSRPEPHNLYTTTTKLWKAAHSKEGAPAPVFVYADTPEGRSKRVSSIHVPYSSASDVVWTWNERAGAYLRSHGNTPHVITNGGRVSAANVVVQVVEERTGRIVDVAGNPSPALTLTGSGKAYVFRDGRMIVGRWERRGLNGVTRFVTKNGTQIALAPGRTWVELVPSSVAVQTKR